MEYDVAIIGGGPAGYSAAESLMKAGKSVVLFEKENMGGVCLNEGCIPTKTLLYSAKLLEGAKLNSKYGIITPAVSFDFSKIMSRKSKVVRKLVLGVKTKLKSPLIEIINGEATICTPHLITCDEQAYSCKSLLLCMGSSTAIPPIDGLDQVGYWTHKEALSAKEVPASLLIMGGGVIGMELAAFYNAMGTAITVVEMLPEIVTGMDVELSALLRETYSKKGIKFLLSTRVTSVKSVDNSIEVTCQTGEGIQSLVVDKLLVSTGRRANNNGGGLQSLSLERTDKHHLVVDKHMETSIKGVYACGDITGQSMLAHTATREADVAVHAILGIPDEMSYTAIPAVVYTHPEFSAVGATEDYLLQNNIPYRCVKIPMSFSGRFVVENEGANGVCKLLIGEDSVLLGAHLLGGPSSELISIAAMVIEQQMTLNDWKRMVFPHPSVSEIFKEAINTIN